MNHFPGIDDDQFIRGPIPMTKQEIRMVVLCKAKIAFNDIVIDIGAGTGSLSIEAGLLAPEGKIYAIEREAEGAKLIKQNASKFGVHNIEIMNQSAPEVLTDLPKANVIFVGGSGGKLASILTVCEGLLEVGGRLLITAVTAETLTHSLAVVQEQNYVVDCSQIQVSRLKKVGKSHMFQALNPIFIIACTKQV